MATITHWRPLNSEGGGRFIAGFIEVSDFKECVELSNKISDIAMELKLQNYISYSVSSTILTIQISKYDDEDGISILTPEIKRKSNTLKEKLNLQEKNKKL